jgi:hypothetical protein
MQEIKREREREREVKTKLVKKACNNGFNNPQIINARIPLWAKTKTLQH